MSYRQNYRDEQEKQQAAADAAEHMRGHKVIGAAETDGKLNGINKDLMDLLKHAGEHQKRLFMIRAHLYGPGVARDDATDEAVQREPDGALNLLEYQLRALHELLNETDKIIQTLESL